MSALGDGFDAVICDLDGVVYTGPVAVDHAVDSLNALTVPVVYATNNASRTTGEVGERLRSFGIVTSDDVVLTSSLAAARELASTVSRGAPVLAIGGEGVAASLRSVGLQPRRPGDEGEVVAVLQGYGPGVTAADLGAAAVAVRSGARWVATNDDLTLPTEEGPVPGNGALVAAVRLAVDVEPEVIGKPHPPMYRLAAQAAGARAARTVAVGDRLETDIAGALAAGMAAVLVLTGVHGPADAAAAPPERRPTHVLTDLRGLCEPYPQQVMEGDWFVRGAARARCGEALEVEGHGVDATRAALDALWDAVDARRITSGRARALLVNR
ncbi:HAD-IIA family hydrolase [Janibacter sp. GS2]|uniref:HAD-IIA family hydrolase n=1 Tax=Janibacter sp. GS2 TaxID=3442646 RepID=UPI003EC06F5B